MQKIKVVLPAYNEEDDLPKLLVRLDKSMQKTGLEMSVLVVNDGSTDNTSAVAKAFKGQIKVDVLDLNPNQGLAGAIKEGLLKAIEDSYDEDDIIVAMDADNTHTPGLIQRMVRHIHEGSDVVIASRYQRGARVVGLSRFRRWMSLGASFLFQSVVGIHGVKDYTCGFRAYRVELLKEAMDKYKEKFIQQTGFGCMIEILLRLESLNPVITEVPMILRYDFKEGESKMNIGRTVKQTLTLLFNYKFKKEF